ncbi:MAG: hypothetical protein MRJ96_06640 [Nitrospirales bacterium]|nr:hypothetical protein [Nitrospira sp.]MDR4501111.1 hypothetical protein [Nitrospirales bacterium]
MFAQSKNPRILVSLLILGALVFSFFPLSVVWAGSDQNALMRRGLMLPNEFIVIGTIQHVKSGLIQVNIDNLDPLFLSLQAAADKGMTSIQAGDKVEIIVSDQNQVIDFRKAGTPGWDKAVKGHLLQPLLRGQKWAVLETEKGDKGTYEVNETVRHTLENIPAGVPAIFLINNEHRVIDATFGEEGTLLDTLAKWAKERQRTLQ